jgi:hypothetical protein
MMSRCCCARVCGRTMFASNMMNPEPLDATLCAHCGSSPRSSARFCGGCGAPLVERVNAGMQEALGVAPHVAARSTPIQIGSLRRTADGRPRSVAWVFYGLIAILGLVLAVHEPRLLLGTLMAGAYSVYLFRGGRFVIWFF